MANKSFEIVQQYKISLRWYYKMYVLCNMQGYAHTFEIHTGQSIVLDGEPDLGPSSNIVNQWQEKSQKIKTT